jgi:uncharacterized protein (TIGR02302 family)
MPLSNATVSLPGSERGARFVRVARWTIFWERFWRALWPASGLVAAYGAFALVDGFSVLPEWIHGLSLFGLVLAVAATLHRNLRGYAWPVWDDGARRVERDSGLVHRPITEGRDVLAAGTGDPLAEELWRAHRERLLGAITNLRLSFPAPRLHRRDPLALRFAALLLLAAGFVLAGRDWEKRLAGAFVPDAGRSMSNVALDAWITPPAYTGEAPVYLAQNGGPGIITVPARSQFTLRVHGARALPHLSLEPAPSGGEGVFGGRSGEYGAAIAITTDSDARLLVDGHRIAHWTIRALPDLPPVIAFAEPPGKTERGALALAFTTADDYGVVSARALIRPADRRSHAMLTVDLPLAQSPARTLRQTVYRDLTSEPLAGTEVEIVLEARDGLGQIGRSKSMWIRLPARTFTNPLSRALIEQRQALALALPHARENAAVALEALTLAPERFYADQAKIYLALRSARWALAAARDPDDVVRVEQLLWDTAVALEQGGLLNAAEELRRLQQMLSEALQQGAPQDVISALLDRYRQALQRYLQALSQAAPQANGQGSADAKSISPQDFEALLKAIERMSQTGSREAAAQALAMLQSLLENLHVAQGNGSGGSGQGNKALSDAMKGLGDAIGRQRELLDKTYRQSQGAGDPKDGGGKGLGQAQGQLRSDLDRTLKGQGDKKSHALGDAERAMDYARKSLEGNAFADAETAQKQALDAMRDSAESLAKQMMKEAGQSEGQRDDPLGRKEGTTGLGAGDGTKVPDRDTLERARAILEELRRRAAERGRPKEELDYYDRLLKEF